MSWVRFGLSDASRAQVLVILIALLCLALLLIFYAGPLVLFDDSLYLGLVKTFLAGTYGPNLNAPFSLEFLTIAALALSLKLLGYNLVALAAPGALEYVGTAILIFLTGRKLFGDAFGLVAAVLAATTPFFVGFATRVLPDMGLAFFCSLAIYLIAVGRNRPLYYLAGGFVGGLAPLVKTEGLAFAMALFLALAATLLAFGAVKIGRHKSEHGRRKGAIGRLSGGFHVGALPELLAVVGLLIGLCLFFAFFYYYMGDPFFSIKNYGKIAAVTTYPNFTQELGRMGTIYFPYTYASRFQAEFSDSGTLLWNNQPIYPTGLLFDLSVLGIIAALIFRAGFTEARGRSLCLIALLLLFGMLYINLGSESITSYQPIQLSPRILLFLMAPASIMATYFIFAARDWLNGKRRHMGTLVAAALVLLVLALNMPLYSFFYNTNMVIRNVSLDYSSVAQQITTYAANNQQYGNVTLYLGMRNGIQRGVLDVLLQYKINGILLQNVTLACKAPVRNNTLLVISGSDPNAYAEDTSLAVSDCNASLVSDYRGYLDTSLYRISAK